MAVMRPSYAPAVNRRGARVGSVRVATDYDGERIRLRRYEDGLTTTAKNQPPSHSTWEVPSWLTRTSAIGWRVLVTVAFGALVVAFAIYLSTVTLSILFAVIAVATLGPFNERMRARGWGGAKAAGGSIGAAVLIVVGALLLIGLALIPFLVDLTQYLHHGLERLSTDLASANVPADTAAALAEAVQQIESWLSQQASAIVDSLVEAGTIVMLGLFLTFYLLLDGGKAWDVGLSGLGGWQRDRIRDAGEEAMRRAGAYVRGTAVIASVDAVSSFVVLTLIGVSLAGPLGVLVLAAGFIPYIGGLFVAGILLLAGLALGGLPTGLLLVAIVVVLKVVEQRRLTSYLSSRTLQLHPAVILLALLIGFTMGGLTGMFVAVPTIAVVSAITGAVLDVLGTTGTARVSMRGDIPAWLDRLAQWSWRLLVAVGLVGLVIAILAQFPVVVGPIVVAVTLAATFLPAVAALERRGWTRGRASFVVSVVVWTAVSVVTVLSITALAGSVQDAVQGATTGGSVADESLPEGVSGIAGQLSELVGSGILEFLGSIVSSLALALVFFIITALLAYFMLRDGDRGWAWITSHLDGWRRREITLAGDRAVTMLGGYMIATGVLAMFNAVTGFIIMTLLGLPLALPVAILSFFGGFIPYIGQFVTSLIGFLIAVAFGTTQDVIVMGIWTAGLNIVQGSVIAPLVYGRAVSLHPAMVLIVIPAGGELAGVLGMFLAVPLVGIIGAVWRHVLAAIGEVPPPVQEPIEQAKAPPIATIVRPASGAPDATPLGRGN
jgi:predicted PurR-regulated permease PerM